MLVTQLSKLYKSSDNTNKKALDFGFGAGRHIKLLKDFDFDAYGLDVTIDAKETMYDSFGKILPEEKS